MCTYSVVLFLLLVDMFLFCGRGSHFLILCDVCMLMLCFYFVINIHRFYAVD